MATTTFVLNLKKRLVRAAGLHHALLCLLAVAFISPVALAKEERETQSYDIAAGSLSDVLAEFAALAGAPLSFDPQRLAGRQSPGLAGRYSAPEGFSILLQDSGYAVRGSGNGAYRLVAANDSEEPEMLPPLTVEGDAQSAQPWLSGDAEKAYRVEDANVGVLGNKTIKNTPYSIEVYSSDLIKNKQARSLADIAKGDASINLMTDNLVHENTYLQIRGLRPDFATGHRIDGLQARTRTGDLPLEHLERIEILKGASGFLYGFGEPGGIINYVLKRPTDEPFQSLSTQVMDSGLALVHGDVGGRLGPDDRFGYRVNLVHESGDTYINDGESRRNSGSIALDWEITPDLVWRFDALLGRHQRTGGNWGVIPNSDIAAFSFTATGKPPSPIDGSQRLTPSFAHLRSIHKNYGSDISWDFAADWTLALAYRYSDHGAEYYVMPFFFSDSTGNYSLWLWNGANRDYSAQSQAVINGIFKTGPISHELTVGISYTRLVGFNDYDSRQISNVGNLFNPVEVNNPFDNIVSYKDADTEFGPNRRRELFLSDTLHLGEDWDIILGLRHSNWDDKLSGYDKSAITPTLAAIFRPIEGLSLYGSYIEALEQGATAPRTAANANQVFPPLKSKQYELGAKAEGDDWSATATLFRIQKGLTYTTSTNMFTQDGEARYQGLEFNSKFRLSPRWLLIASAMWLDATNQKTTGGALDGKHIVGAAREQASLYGEYRIEGLPLTLTAGARYIGKRPLDSNNRFYVGDVTLFDMGARYETKIAGKGLTLRLNLDNLADEAYWITSFVGISRQGMPRTFKLGIELDF